jgi:hypothetical protein
MGYNSCPKVHTDIISTSNRTVTARLRNGTENGKSAQRDHLVSLEADHSVSLQIDHPITLEVDHLKKT